MQASCRGCHALTRATGRASHPCCQPCCHRLCYQQELTRVFRCSVLHVCALQAGIGAGRTSSSCWCC